MPNFIEIGGLLPTNLFFKIKTLHIKFESNAIITSLCLFFLQLYLQSARPRSLQAAEGEMILDAPFSSYSVEFHKGPN